LMAVWRGVGPFAVGCRHVYRPTNPSTGLLAVA
jgi:hypothetical protein